MQREIKFRAFRDDDKPGFVFFTLAGRKFNIPYLAERFPISQFTGLLDKNGKEIFEGDIVREPLGGNWEVEVRDLESGVVLVNNVTEMASLSYVDKDFSLKECEIIGNIYENSELLK